MGCAPSAFDLAVQNNESLKQNLAQYYLLQLSDHDVRKLYNIFHEIDGYGGDIVELVDMLAYTDLPNKGFAPKIFSELNDNYTGTIDFNEFVLALWNYCTLTKGTLDTFAFDLYDKEGAGELSSTQMLGMIEDMFGKIESKTNAAIKTVIAELQDFERRKVVFSLDRFRKFTKTNNAVLVPAYQILETLQKKTLGVVNWEQLAEKRMKLSNGRYLSLKKFIALQGSGKPYTSLSTPGQSRDDESHPSARDVPHDAGNTSAQEQPTVATKTTASTTSFGLSDSSKESACMTLSSKPSSTPGLTDSAKVRWTASLQSLVTAVSAKSSRRGKTNRVHASPKSSFGGRSSFGTNRNKNKSRHNSTSSDADRTEPGRVSPVPSNAIATVTSSTATSTAINLTSGDEITPEPSARRRSVTFGETAGTPVTPADTKIPTSTATVTAGDDSLKSPKNVSARGAYAHRDVSPRPNAGSGATAGFNAAGISPKASFGNGSSARSTGGASSSQRRGSKDIVIWSNDSEPTNTSPKTVTTSQSPKNANNINSNNNINNNKNAVGNTPQSNASTPASTARAGSLGDVKPLVLFNDKMAFVPHDDAALAARSRPAARRSVILPGAVEDAQGLTEYMQLHQKCRSSD